MRDRLLRRIASRLGYDVVRADFNSPLVRTRELPDTVWDRPAAMPGLELELDGQLAAIDAGLAPLIAEFSEWCHADPGFDLDNPWYGPMDAHLLYAILRASKPGRVVELGSGYSSLVIARALAVNRDDGHDGSHVVVDPYPSPLLSSLADAEVHAESAADVSPERFRSLGAGDVLFVDSSHTVRPGGEVVRIVLEVLPELSSGVVVQIHDFFRPFEYPRVLYDAFDVHWQEQYLVQAFLAFNPGFSILYSNHALWRLRREQALERFGGLHPGREPSALWLIRR